MSLSPTSDDEDVKVSHEPGVGPPVLAGMYSADVSNVTMSKGEKHAFVSGLSIMNEQDHVLTALVRVTPPLNAVHMVVITESELAWERPDVAVLQLDMDCQKTRKKLMHIISKKPPGLLVAMFDQVPTPEVLHDLWDEMDLAWIWSGCLGGKQIDEVRQDLLDWEHLGIAPRCFADAKSLEMLELLNKRSEERYLNSYTRTCFVGETIEDDEEGDSILMELERFDDSLSPMEQEQLHLDQLALPGSMDEQKRRTLWRRLPQRTKIAIRLHHQERRGRQARDQEHQSDQDQQATLLNPDVAKKLCWRRCAGCKIRLMTSVTSARRDLERDQGQHSGDDTLDDPGQILDGHVGIGILD